MNSAPLNPNKRGWIFAGGIQLTLLISIACDAQIASKSQAMGDPIGPQSWIEGGQRIVSVYGCTQCHAADGNPMVGPTFKDMFGSTIKLASGDFAKVDESYVEYATRNPGTKVHAGFPPVMPAYTDRISQREMQAIIWYLKSISKHVPPELLKDGKQLIPRLTKAEADVDAIQTPTTAPAKRVATTRNATATAKPQQRTQTPIDPTTILKMDANTKRGEQIFKSTSCVTCHLAGDVGLRDYGPDLSHVAAKFSKTQVLQKLINPSEKIAPRYVSYFIARKSNSMKLLCFIVSEDATELVIQDLLTPDLETRHIPRTDIKSMRQVVGENGKPLSAMPIGTLDPLTPQQTADLLEFLDSLK
jgi:putative heme-binding domain-containing protein